MAPSRRAAPPFGVELSPLSVRDNGEIERGFNTFARGPNGGLIVTAGTFTAVHRELITTLAARHRSARGLPLSLFRHGGGLISYGPDTIGPVSACAGYVDRILKGEKPADLPVQAPTKFELVINLKTAKALGLDMPPIAARPRRRGDRIGKAPGKAGAISRCKSGPGKAVAGRLEASVA